MTNQEIINRLYLELLFVAVILIGILFINNIVLYKQKLKDRISIMLLTSVVLGCFEILWAFCEGHPNLKALTYIGACGYMILFVIFTVLLNRYIFFRFNRLPNSRCANILFYIVPPVIFSVLCVTTPWTHWFVSVDEAGVKAAIIEGAAATLIIMIFAKQFCGLFGVTGGESLPLAIKAIRIVSLGFVFCSTVSLTTSYYMLIDRIGMATCFTCLQNGLLYILLPILGSVLFGFNGLWVGFVVAPVLTLICAFLFVYLRFGKDNFQFLLKSLDKEIIVMDDILTPKTATILSRQVAERMFSHGYTVDTAGRAAMFTEEIGLTVLDVNERSKKPVLVELSLFFEEEHVLIIERDSGKLFDLTDPDAQIKGLSGFILSGLMEAHNEKAYRVTTGYNRNMIRFYRKQENK